MQTAKQSCELLLKVQPQVHAYLANRLTLYRSSIRFSTTANWKRQVRKLRAQEKPNFDLALYIHYNIPAVKLEPSGFMVEVSR